MGPTGADASARRSLLLHGYCFLVTVVLLETCRQAVAFAVRQQAAGRMGRMVMGLAPTALSVPAQVPAG